MSNRRDVLLGIGAGIGVTALTLGAAARRSGRGHELGYGFAATGASVEDVGGHALRCTAGTLTSGQIEGPFYTPKTPERRDIRDPLVAEALVLVGRVLDTAGRFELVTVRPSTYTAMNIFRTAHIHVKVQGANTGLLTTQLYLPDLQETNARDGGYDPALAIEYVGHEAGAERAVFDFVLASA
jgi:protocatechuate 3,4-dioxygenase beta subunit